MENKSNDCKTTVSIPYTQVDWKTSISNQVKRTIQVYMKNSIIYEYDIYEKTEEDANAKVREHMGAIMATGYRHCGEDGVLEWFPPEWISKLKCTGCFTKYPDRIKST